MGLNQSPLVNIIEQQLRYISCLKLLIQFCFHVYLSFHCQPQSTSFVRHIDFLKKLNESVCHKFYRQCSDFRHFAFWATFVLNHLLMISRDRHVNNYFLRLIFVLFYSLIRSVTLGHICLDPFPTVEFHLWNTISVELLTSEGSVLCIFKKQRPLHATTTSKL